MSAVDTLVVGGGVDGLVAAVALAKGGRKAVVVEASDHVGGIAAAEEFHPGFRHQGVFDTATLRPHVVAALGLSLTYRPSPAPAVPQADAAGYARMRKWLAKIRPFATAVLDEPPPDVRSDAPLWPLVKPAIGLRRLGRSDMMELLRIGPMAAEDWLLEHLSDGPVAAALALQALRGAWMGPKSPTGTAYVLFRDALLSGKEVVGGPAALVDALERACAQAGVVIRTNAPVARIPVADGAVQGVRLADGTDLYARNVLSTLGPRRTLLDLVDPAVLPATSRAEVVKVRVRGTVAVAHLALSSAPAFGEHAVLCDDLVHAERAFDAAKNGVLPSWPPPIEIRVAGNVATALVHGVAHDLRGGWTDEARKALWEQVLVTLQKADPAIRDRLVAHRVLVPSDLEARFGLEGGHLHGAEDALDQLWSLRPTPGLAGYKGPFRGLYLGSRGQHPGMGLTGVPGLLAARALMGR